MEVEAVTATGRATLVEQGEEFRTLGRVARRAAPLPVSICACDVLQSVSHRNCPLLRRKDRSRNSCHHCKVGITLRVMIADKDGTVISRTMLSRFQEVRQWVPKGARADEDAARAEDIRPVTGPPAPTDGIATIAPGDNCSWTLAIAFGIEADTVFPAWSMQSHTRGGGDNSSRRRDARPSVMSPLAWCGTTSPTGS